MSLKEDLLALVWKYGWKEMEVNISSLKDDFVKRSEEIMKEMKTGPASGSALRPSSARAKTAPAEEKPQEPEKLQEEPSKSQNEVIIPEEEEEEPKKKQAQEKKKIQREKEKEKRQENEAKGIFAKDLLTEDNLKLWKDKNYSNAYISRELVGCREEDVAKAKKKYKV